MPELILNGCAPVPLARYLKALGVLNVLSKQGAQPVRCIWSNRTFSLETDFSESALIRFFLESYVPSPVVVPWSGSDFFGVDREAQLGTFEKAPTSSEVIEAFLKRSEEHTSELQSRFGIS